VNKTTGTACIIVFQPKTLKQLACKPLEEFMTAASSQPQVIEHWEVTAKWLVSEIHALRQG